MLHSLYAVKREDGSFKGIYDTISEACRRGGRVKQGANGRIIPKGRTKLVPVIVVECDSPKLVRVWESKR